MSGKEWRAQVRDGDSQVLATFTSTRSLKRVEADAVASLPKHPRAREIALFERVGPGWDHLQTSQVGGSDA